MPNYVTHAVMGSLIEIPSSRVELNQKKLSAFSVGHDLLFSESGAMDETHNTKTKEFFYTLIKYIIENRLYDNSDVMAYLYGHIMHYQLDKMLNPYIYYMTNGVSKSRILNFHMASEEFLGTFVAKNRISLSRKDIISNINEVSNISDDSFLANTINDVYSRVYGYYDCLSSMKKTVTYIKALEVFKHLLKEEKSPVYYNIIGLEHYLKKADMAFDTLTNEQRSVWCDPISKLRKDSSFLEMFDEAISSSQEIIEKVNSIIYGDKDLSKLDGIFSNESYDTGLSCEIGKPFVKSRYRDFCNRVRS